LGRRSGVRSFLSRRRRASSSAGTTRKRPRGIPLRVSGFRADTITASRTAFDDDGRVGYKRSIGTAEVLTGWPARRSWPLREWNVMKAAASAGLPTLLVNTAATLFTVGFLGLALRDEHMRARASLGAEPGVDWVVVGLWVLWSIGPYIGLALL